MQYEKLNTNTNSTQMNLCTVKWAHCDKTQSRELNCLFMCACDCAQLLYTIQFGRQ